MIIYKQLTILQIKRKRLVILKVVAPFSAGT